MSSNPYYIKSDENKKACSFLLQSFVGCPNASIHCGYYSCLQLVMGRLYDLYPTILETCFEDWEDRNKSFNFHSQVIQRYERSRRNDVKQYDKRKELEKTIALLKKLKDYRVKADYKKNIYESDINEVIPPLVEEFHKIIKTI